MLRQNYKFERKGPKLNQNTPVNKSTSQHTYIVDSNSAMTPNIDPGWRLPGHDCLETDTRLTLYSYLLINDRHRERVDVFSIYSRRRRMLKKIISKVFVFLFSCLLCAAPVTLVVFYGSFKFDLPN